MNCPECTGTMYASHSPLSFRTEVEAVLFVLECYDCRITLHQEVPLPKFTMSHRLYDTHYELMEEHSPGTDRVLGAGERVA